MKALDFTYSFANTDLGKGADIYIVSESRTPEAEHSLTSHAVGLARYWYQHEA